MNPLAILHLVNSLADSSIERVILRLIRGLGSADYRWHIGLLRKPHDLADEFRALGAHVVDFSAEAGAGSQVERIRAYIAANEICLVHTHTQRTILMTQRAFHHSKRIKHLATKHQFYLPKDRHWGTVFALLDRAFLFLPDHTVAVSDSMYRQMLSIPTIGPHRVSLIRNAIECEAYYVPEQREECRAEFGLSTDMVVFGYTGRLAQVKRLDVLIEAFAQVYQLHPEIRLIIAGEGELRQDLEALALRLGLSDAVLWTGFRTDIPRLLAAIDIFVQSSRNEGLSLSLLEAMAARKAIIATGVGGTSEVIEHEQTGLMVTAGSSPALAASMMDLIDHPHRRYMMAQAAGDYAARHFDIQRVADSYRHLYESLLQETSLTAASSRQRHLSAMD